MPLNSYLRQKFGGGDKEYVRENCQGILYDRAKQSTTIIKNRDFTPLIPSTAYNPKAKSISSGNESSAMGTNSVPMKMLKSKFIIGASRG